MLNESPTGDESSENSTIPRRRLAAELRKWRAQSKMTQAQAAREMEWSAAKMTRLENGKIAVRLADIRQLCEMYHVPSETTEILLGIAQEAKTPSWARRLYGDVLPQWFDFYIGMEAAASDLWWYDSELVFGLLQTKDYARAVLRTADRNAAPEEIERLLELRMSRQAILRRTEPLPPNLRLLFNEAVIRRPVGGPAVMSEQLKFVNRVGEMSNVSIRVLPFAAGEHAAMLGGFSYLRFPNDDPDVVYLDIRTDALYMQKPHEIVAYRGMFEDAWEVALDETASRNLITAAVKEYAP